MPGTDADPYDPNRGVLYRYIGWFLMHKTPKMIEAAGYKHCFKHGDVLGPEGVFGFSTQMKMPEISIDFCSEFSTLGPLEEATNPHHFAYSKQAGHICCKSGDPISGRLRSPPRSGATGSSGDRGTQNLTLVDININTIHQFTHQLPIKKQ